MVEAAILKGLNSQQKKSRLDHKRTAISFSRRRQWQNARINSSGSLFNSGKTNNALAYFGHYVYQ